jgi:hypothetical protein
MAPAYLPTFSHTRHDFRGGVIEYEVCFDFLHNFCLTKFLILRRTQRDIVISGKMPSRKVPVITVAF